MKVHLASTQMEAATRAELQGLGVPFFGTRAELVVGDGAAAAGREGVVEAAELEGLRRRMVGFLEDLVRD
jgi:hypothetical protein